MKLKDRFAAFMYGRNGNDEFYTFLMGVALALLIVAWIFMIAGLHVVYIILYRRCPGCRVTLRLPKRKGKHTVVCPKCGRRFEVKI